MPTPHISLALGVLGVSLAIALASCSSEPPAEVPVKPELTIVFSPPGGTFIGSQNVVLTSAPDAIVHFTTDGSLPTEKSPIYSEPIVVEKSTRLRAVAIRPAEGADAGSTELPSAEAGVGGGSASPSAPTQGPVQSSSYLRLQAEQQEFTSHLPIVLIHTFESGSIKAEGDTFQPARLQVLMPEQGSTHVLGTAVLDTRIGIHVRGETSRDFAKKAYAVEIWSETEDQDTDLPLLGMPEESDWILSDPIDQDRSLIRNALAFELSNRIGRYAPRTRFAEAYLVTDGGDVRQQSFLGLYTVMEKIKRGAQRVNVAKLANGTTESELTGGYLLRDDKGTADFRGAETGWQFVYPESADMKLPTRAKHREFIQGYVDGFGKALWASDFVNPASGMRYSEYIDVEAFVDHNIINALLKNVDGLRYSTYYHKDRDGRLAIGPVWDFDRSSGTPYDDRATAPNEWKRAGSDGTDFLTQGYWEQLFRDPEFKARYIERFLELLDNEFAPDELDAAVDSLAGRVGEAAERDFARWKESPPRDGSHAAEISLLKDFLRQRVEFLRGELERGL